MTRIGARPAKAGTMRLVVVMVGGGAALPLNGPKEGGPGHPLHGDGSWSPGWVGGASLCWAALSPTMDCLKEGGPGRCHSLQEALDCHSSCYDAWADPRPFVIAVSLPGLGPLTGLPSSALTAEELKYSDIGNIGAMIAPWHFLEVKLGKRPPPVKSELEEEKERRKRRWEKNKVKVAAAQPDAGTRRGSGWSFCSGKRLELMNVELKTQMEELKQERQQLILMLSWHCPTCIVRTDSVKTTAQKAIHCWSSWRRSDHGQGGGRGGRGDGDKEEEEGPRELFLAA